MKGSREHKTKSLKPKRFRGAAAADDDNDGGPAQHEDWHGQKLKKGSKRDKYLKGAAGDPDEPPRKGGMGAVNLYSLAEDVFMQWEELLGSREALRSRVHTIAAVHGWEGRSSRRNFLGGIEPESLLVLMRAELALLGPACESLDRADLLLELQKKGEAIQGMCEERDRLADDLAIQKEDCFEARDQLDMQTEE